MNEIRTTDLNGTLYTERFELQEFHWANSAGTWRIDGWVVWDHVEGRSMCEGVVPDRERAEEILDTAIGAQRALDATELARRQREWKLMAGRR